MNSFLKNYFQKKTAGYVEKDIDITPQMVRFDMGENFLDPPEGIEKILTKYTSRNLHHYPDHEYSSLRQILAEKFDFDEKNIVPTAGADEAILLLPRAICEPGDTSIIATPTFFRIIEANTLFKIETKTVQLFEEEGFAYTDDFVKRFIQSAYDHDATTAWICSPNNPTGTVLKESQLQYILTSLPENCYLIIDEVSQEFYDPENTYSAMKYVKDYQNLIILRSLSKSYALANFRIGYVVANEHVINSLYHVKPVFNLSGISEAIGIHALQDDKYIKKMSAKNNQVMINLRKAITSLEYINIASHSRTNFLMVKHKAKDIYEELLSHNILVADFRNTQGLEGKGYVRITIRDEETNKKLIDALKRIN